MAESRMEAGILFQVAGAESANECLWKSEEVWGRCRVVVVPERSALNGWCRCSRLQPNAVTTMPRHHWTVTTN